MREKISACITAFNEEHKIERCLASVAWADEIIVVDSFSQDNTVEVCRRYTDHVYRHQWLGYIGQKNLIKDMATNPWILFVDADEEVSPKLKDEILAELEPVPRNFFSGCLFWFGDDGSMDSSILIRSLVISNAQVMIGAGGGIVSDSDPEKEWLEANHKARPLTTLLGFDPEEAE